jgi:uncharacterized protein YaeQ
MRVALEIEWRIEDLKKLHILAMTARFQEMYTKYKDQLDPLIKDGNYLRVKAWLDQQTPLEKRSIRWLREQASKVGITKYSRKARVYLIKELKQHGF